MSDSLPRLKTSKGTATLKLRDRITSLETIEKIPLTNVDSVVIAENEYKKWTEFTKTLLLSLFDSVKFHRDYAMSFDGWYFDKYDHSESTRSFHSGIKARISFLESVIEQLDLLEEIPTKIDKKTSIVKSFSNRIFIVHGHDNELKQEIARFVEKLDLNPIILHEQPDKGRTVIEKFEDYSDVGYAIVLLTPDDVGYPKDDDKQAKHRARQNVILELGFFLGKLGREKVCSVYKEGVEIPSDYHGVLYKPYDTQGGWKLNLAKEIKESGLNIDLNKVI